jgi:hypothetical protein
MASKVSIYPPERRLWKILPSRLYNKRRQKESGVPQMQLVYTYLKLYFTLALHSTYAGQIQYKKCPIRMYWGIKTVFSLWSMAWIQRIATASRRKPCLFGSASCITGEELSGVSTADARKSPSIVVGRTDTNDIRGCSIASA